VRDKIILPFEKFLFTRSEFRNTELRLDNLKLRNLVDKRLNDISGNEFSSLFLYNPEYDGANVYALNADYTTKGNDITVSCLLIKGGSEIINRFEVKGSASNPEIISEQIVAKVVQWSQNK